MSDHDRFRGQDPDNESTKEDEMSAAMGGYDESSMVQEQGGRAPGRDLGNDFSYGRHDEYPTEPDESGMHAGREAESRGDEDESPDDETEGGR